MTTKKINEITGINLRTINNRIHSLGIKHISSKSGNHIYPEETLSLVSSFNDRNGKKKHSKFFILEYYFIFESISLEEIAINLNISFNFLYEIVNEWKEFGTITIKSK